MASSDISSYGRVCRRIGLKIGSDPEFFIARQSDDSLVSAIKVFPGHGKENKITFNDGQSIFYDNVLLEFNINPARTFYELASNFSRLIIETSKLLGKKGLRLAVRSSAEFPAGECDDMEASIFGCDPEYCIYSRTEDGKIMRVEPPMVGPGNTFRSCGGHIHIGHVIANIDTGGSPAMVVKLMDAFVGAMSLLVDQDPSSKTRRKLYGGAGMHRITPYGLEYRTLSNFWWRDPYVAQVIYKLTRLALQLALTKPTLLDNVISEDQLKNLINKSQTKEAQELYKALQPHMSFELIESIDLVTQPNKYINSFYDMWANYGQSLAA